MAKVETISADEKRWREEDDVRTLTEAQVIQKDPKRLKAAIERAKKMAAEQSERAEATRRVARMRQPMKGK